MLHGEPPWNAVREPPTAYALKDPPTLYALNDPPALRVFTLFDIVAKTDHGGVPWYTVNEPPATGILPEKEDATGRVPIVTNHAVVLGVFPG